MGTIISKHLTGLFYPTFKSIPIQPGIRTGIDSQEVSVARYQILNRSTMETLWWESKWLWVIVQGVGCPQISFIAPRQVRHLLPQDNWPRREKTQEYLVEGGQKVSSLSDLYTCQDSSSLIFKLKPLKDMDCKSRLNTLSDSSVTMLTHNYDAVVLKKHNNDFFFKWGWREKGWWHN